MVDVLWTKQHLPQYKEQKFFPHTQYEQQLNEVFAKPAK